MPDPIEELLDKLRGIEIDPSYISDRQGAGYYLSDKDINQIQALIDSAVTEARIDELEKLKLEGCDYRTARYIQQRLKSLHKESSNNDNS